MSKTSSKNFYIIGKVMGGQRTENLIKYLLDDKKPVYYNSFKNTNKLPSLLFVPLQKLSNLINLFIADVVILPAMCNRYAFEFKIAHKLKKKIITDFYISLYDTHVLDKKPFDNNKIIAPNSSTAKKLMKIDKGSIVNADYTLFLNSTEAKYYLQILDLEFDPQKHLILPICSDERFVCDLKFYKNKERNVFNICWWGTYIPLHGLEKIIKSAKILKDNYNFNFHLHLFGTNEEKARPYISLVDDLNIADVVSIYNDKTFSNGKLGSFLQEYCDLVLGNFGDSDKAKNVIVNKIIDGVAMKAPVLSGESKAPLEFFSEHDIFYTENIPEAMAHTIYNISRVDKEEIVNRVENSYEIFNKHFTIKAYNEKLKTLITSI
jgi:hypothetical protein